MRKKQYIAHIREDTGEIQTVKEHCINTANLSRQYAIPELKDIAYVIGMFHDVGKYQESFVRKITTGKNIRVEHSTCGALVVKEKYPYPVSIVMEYCIAGHHSGIPDGGFPGDGPEQSTLQGRMKRNFENYEDYRTDLEFNELNQKEFMDFLIKDCDGNADKLIDKFAFITRYLFSCLVDADSSDTASFCNGEAESRKLIADFETCLSIVNQKLASFINETQLQKTRSELQRQAFQRADNKSEIYLMNMPTGSGKTLTSVKIALEKVCMDKTKKRIIYIIPYNSIIDQMATVVDNMFKDHLEILRHQSTFSYEDREEMTEDYRKAAKLATENWDAPFIITTSVQFFESIYSNRRGKLRKLHNMADSILIFDEAHMMPQEYLQPCLQAVTYITRYLNSEAIFLTATMPDFENLLRKYALSDSKIINLIEDKKAFEYFKKCRYEYTGEITEEQLITRSIEYPSTLIIVNKKETARKLFQNCTGQKYHLSTYMTVRDRKKVLQEIEEQLRNLETDFPGLNNVSPERRITIISTSLIEAGVDLDVSCVFREILGLDNILQAGGRCNREGKRKTAKVFVFELEESGREKTISEKISITKDLFNKYKDVSDPACIEEYYRRLFCMKNDAIQKNTIHQMHPSLDSIPFKEYAESFNIIDDRSISLVINQDEKSEILINSLRYGGSASTRELQNYTCTISQRDLEELIEQNVVDDFGTGIFCLTNTDYYDEEQGILFEGHDYFL